MIEGSDFGLQELLLMLGGAGVTLQITFYAVLGGTLMGLVFGLVRAVAPWWINWPLGGILDVFRSVPLLIQLVLVNSFKSILNLPTSAFVVSCVVLAFYTSSYCSEIVRAGVQAVPPTTRRAARSLGLTYWQDLRVDRPHARRDERFGAGVVDRRHRALAHVAGDHHPHSGAAAGAVRLRADLLLDELSDLPPGRPARSEVEGP